MKSTRISNVMSSSLSSSNRTNLWFHYIFRNNCSLFSLKHQVSQTFQKIEFWSSSFFVFNTPSKFLKPSKCAFPILVIMPCVGLAIWQSSAISPNLLAPISMMAISCCAFIWSRVRGTPIWLLRFPEVQSTWYFCFSTQWINSLVLVLPLQCG